MVETLAITNCNRDMERFGRQLPAVKGLGDPTRLYSKDYFNKVSRLAPSRSQGWHYLWRHLLRPNGAGAVELMNTGRRAVFAEYCSAMTALELAPSQFEETGKPVASITIKGE
ncbi:hypothetical protein K1W69_02520 [Hoeflea sp. WL0058]|uniref:Uncharacterized protein n=1 Tax=Flavimaribacter sediminis TaxID=2865987 RepID=A0AAE2ZJB7_9HYPH|nr:hypothetical protein [Flavimaribacter sediminis]MBW8636046.1 hypothetical protein [Flavimaribacter sediminis]